MIWYPTHLPVDFPGDNVGKRPFAIATRREPSTLKGK
jgi:hypothetical protein